MRNKSTGGFTLIELLIVIAIIGILAAVLIPNLMSARQQAQTRAAQAHSSNVYTALTAALAGEIEGTPEDFQLNTAGTDCDVDDTTFVEYTGGAAVADTDFSINAAPGGLAATPDGCEIIYVDNTGAVAAAGDSVDFVVQVQTINDDYFQNGQPVELADLL